MLSSGSSLGGIVAMLDLFVGMTILEWLCVERKSAMLCCSCKELKSVRGKDHLDLSKNMDQVNYIFERGKQIRKE